MTWLVTGGAGYIGSHVVRALLAEGEPVVVLDDLSTGVAARVPASVPFVRGSVADETLLRRTFAAHAVAGVVHLAGRKSVAESTRTPLRYYDENVGGLVTLLRAMTLDGVRRLLYSSSAAVYGTPAAGGLLDESAATRPANPYGRSKLVGEWVVGDAVAAGQLQAVVLRYFNVVGCAGPDLADSRGVNLFPQVLAAIERRRPPVVFGHDYPTADGTCVRDYVHVVDLADAHVAATALLGQERAAPEVVNIGRGLGYSVLEVLRAFADVSGARIAPRLAARRAGDPAYVVADASRAAELLDWTSRLDLYAMVESAWQGHRQLLAG